MKTFGTKILGTGLAVPKKVVTNDDLAKIVETPDEWISTRTGIKQRHFIDREAGESHLSMCVDASLKALKNSNLKPEDLDFILVGTISADTVMPNASCRLADALGGLKVGAYDLSAACSGYLYALHTADAFIKAGIYKKILVVGAECFSGAVDFKDRTTCVLFGDGAAASVVAAVENPNPAKDSMVLGSVLHTHADVGEHLAIKAGGSRTPVHNPRFNVEEKPYITMSGQEVFKLASRGMVQAAKEVLEKTGYSMADIKWFVPHQANLRIIDMVAKLLEFPLERTYINVDRWANTSAATVPICLAEMDEKGLLNRGDLVLLDVFGGGFTFGATLIRW